MARVIIEIAELSVRYLISLRLPPWTAPINYQPMTAFFDGTPHNARENLVLTMLV